tara:strand:+ start:1142 stop:1909 length:768 start_codon:yes stop_codon:yes gene_type:complete
MKTRVNLVMAEFGANRNNAGGNNLSNKDRLNPSLDSFLRIFKREDLEISVTVYTDHPGEDTAIIKYVKKDPIYNNVHPRFGWRCNDYYKVLALLESNADIAISLDSDMFVLSTEALTLLDMTKKFGVCLPANPRMLVNIDGNIGADGNKDKKYDASKGNGFANNMSPISFDTNNTRARLLLEQYCTQMENDPVRGPLAMWRAQWTSGVNPYLLPYQWCVCKSHCGIGNEIMLHVGHKEVAEYYSEKVVASLYRTN